MFGKIRLVFLKLIEVVYQTIGKMRNFVYDFGLFKPYKCNAKVISVGNLSFGGTGKTPFVIFLVEILKKNAVVVSKSYRGDLKKPAEVKFNHANDSRIFGDEPCVIKKSLADVRVFSGPNKKKVAQFAESESRPDCIVLDDGFSHRALYRDFDIVLFDASVGVNTFFREPKEALKRAHALIFTKLNSINPEQLNSLEKEILEIAPNLKNSIFQSFSESYINLNEGRSIYIFCSIAKPEQFLLDMKNKGYKIAGTQFFSDHYRYSEQDQKLILDSYYEVKRVTPDLVLVTTEKDLVKLNNKNLLEELSVVQYKFNMNAIDKEGLLEKIRSRL